MRQTRVERVGKFVLGTLVAAAMLGAGCASDGVDGDNVDAGPRVDGGANDRPDAMVADSACDMTGRWVAMQVTVSVALSSDQTSRNFYWYDITQTGDNFTITRGANCGFIVDGTTTVTLPDATLAALAKNENSNGGRKGTFKEIDGGTNCQFDLDRTYNVRGADRAAFLTDHWNEGDPDKALDTFPALPKTPPGMEDWDGDTKDGITLTTGLGERYVAQRDWNEHSGVVPAFSTEFGGDGVVNVMWDGQEAVSDQTSLLLRTGSTPKPGGYAHYAKVDDALTVVTSGATPELDTCKNAQALITARWP